MNTELTVYANSISEVYYFAIEQGASAEELAARTGLHAKHFDNPDARIPVQKLVSLWHAAVELTGNSALALHLGATSNPDNAGIISLLCMEAPTVGEMFERVIRYMRIITESDNFKISEGEETFRFIFEINSPETFTAYAIERTFATTINWISIFSGIKIRPIRVDFQYQAPDYLPEYKKVFSSPLFFEQANNALVFSKDILSLPSKSYNHYLDDLVKKQAKVLLKELSAEIDIKQQVQQLIIKQLPIGQFSVNIISEKMNMNRRTLARKLKAENTSFHDLLEATRKQLATYYLEQNTISISEIAFMLGFSESSAFSRAFKQWFGCNPLDHRNSSLK